MNSEVEHLLGTLLSERPMQRLVKGALLVPVNSICEELFFLHSGLLRTFYYDAKGLDKTHWFTFENESVCILSSLLYHKSMPYGIQALEDCSYQSLPKSILETVLETEPAFTKIAFNIVSKVAIDMADRVVDLQISTAKERYEKLIALHPHIFQRVQLQYIASYLGMTKQSLSRIRANY